MTDYVDQEIICCDCRKPFIFEAGEQKFFAERDFTPPKRCKECRAAKKAKRSDDRPARPREVEEFVEVWEDDRRDRGRGRKRRGRDDRSG